MGCLKSILINTVIFQMLEKVRWTPNLVQFTKYLMHMRMKNDLKKNIKNQLIYHQYRY